MSRQAHDEGGTDGRGIEPKAQQVGVQISRSVYSELKFYEMLSDAGFGISSDHL